MLSRKEVSMSTATNNKCRKCKQSIQSGVVSIKCGSISHPSSAKLLENVKMVSDSQIVYCDTQDDEQSDAETDIYKYNIESPGISYFNDIIREAMGPLLIKIHALRQEDNILKDTNRELVRLLTT